MIDLEKEFRTLRLLASAMMIIGAGLMVGGFGIALLMRDSPSKERKPSNHSYPVEATTDAAAEATSPMVPTPKISTEEYKEKFSHQTGHMGVPAGMLGLLLVGLGWTLSFIIRNNIDDVDDPKDNQELFKAYAEQLVIAERQRAKNRKRLH